MDVDQGAIVYHQEIFDKSYGIYPFSKWRKIWEYLMLIVSLLSIYQVPFELLIRPNHTSTMIYPGLILDFLFFIDIYIVFHTGIILYGIACLNKRIILSKMPKYKKIITILQPIPIYLIGIFFPHKPIVYEILVAFKLLRAFRLYDSYTTIKYTLEYVNSYSRIFLSFIGVLTYIVFSAEIVTFSAIKQKPHNNWLTNAGFATSSNFEDFLIGIYFITTRVFTVGYGDITPITFLDVVLLFIVDFFGIMYFNWFLLNVITLFARPARRKLYGNFLHLRYSLMHRGIDEDLVGVLERYYGFLWENERDWANFYETKEKLPRKLMQDISFCLRSELFRHLKVMSIEREMLGMIANLMKPRIFRPGEVILYANTISQSLFFIVDGTVEALNKHGALVANIDNNSDCLMIGYSSMLNGKRETFHYVAQTYIESCEIPKNDLEKIREICPEFVRMIEVYCANSNKTEIALDVSHRQVIPILPDNV